MPNKPANKKNGNGMSSAVPVEIAKDMVAETETQAGDSSHVNDSEVRNIENLAQNYEQPSMSARSNTGNAAHPHTAGPAAGTARATGGGQVTTVFGPNSTGPASGTPGPVGSGTIKKGGQ